MSVVPADPSDDGVIGRVTPIDPAAGVPPAPHAPVKRRVLMLTHRLPFPPDRGDRIRSFHLLKLLARHFDLAVACTSDEPVRNEQRDALAAMAQRVAITPISRRYSRLRGVAAMLAGRAATPAAFFRPSLARTIQRWDEREPFDAILTFCTGMIDYARLLTCSRRPGSPVPVHILDLVDVDSMKWLAYARQSRQPLRWVYSAESRRLRAIEAGCFDRFDAITFVSHAEAEAYRQHVGERPHLHIVTNGVDLDYFQPLPDADTRRLVFIGVLDYRPNVDGIEWFVEHVMPPLRCRVAGARLSIVGRNPTRRVLELRHRDGVDVVGSVDDVRVHLRQAAAVIAPLRIARGMQNKVLEAMAAARAVVCSPAAFEGIDAVAGRDLLVGTEPQHWANTLERVLTEASYRQMIARSARRRVEQGCDWDRCLEPMIGLLSGQGPATYRAAG